MTTGRAGCPDPARQVGYVAAYVDAAEAEAEAEADADMPQRPATALSRRRGPVIGHRGTQ
ncbi:hypothetical protein GCM10010302_45550 [Streptomyces polychromogenes]|uniref:Uncharacterized protein n=1 Tax=Streptomyces polychromogenes TaxID=67342 RepID=A0ABN0VHG9_9ACTN